MSPNQENPRQKQLEQVMKEALRLPELKEAISAFQMSQFEYRKALAGSKNIQITSGSSSNPGGDKNASLDINDRRDNSKK